MDADVRYKRSRFATRLPADRLYTASHFWIAEQEPGVWRVGLTKFAGRMLGDVVDLGFDVRVGENVDLGQAIGWLEGFKARTDLYAVVAGRFAGGNPDLDADIDLIDTDRYRRGWLYAVEGRPDPDACDVQGYVKVLDETIDRLRGHLK
jgi:glycine cleavage system H protein